MLELAVSERTFTFRDPIATAFGALTQRTVLEIDLYDDGALVGRGECAPLEPYDGVSLPQVHAALDRYAEVLTTPDLTTGAQILDACSEANPLPQALAGLDIALWDRGGRDAGRSIAALLAEHPTPTVLVNATVGARTPDAVGQACAAAARAGYTCVKVKVGFDDDEARLAAARQSLGPHIDLRIDANGAWDVGSAVDRIGALAPFGLELVEEPVHGLTELQSVRERTATRIAMDESTAIPGAIASRCADAICLKLSRCGGISGLLAAAALVRANGGDAYVASTFDGPRGVAAAVHACSAFGAMPACGLATLALFEGDWPALHAYEGTIAVPSGPGLGAFEV